MKIKNIHILALLAAICTAGTTYGVADTWTHTDPKYSNVQYSNVGGNVTFTVTDGENLSDFDMYYHPLDKGKDNDNGVLIGGASTFDSPVSNVYENNAAVSSVTINLNGGEGLKFILGMGYSSSEVTGAITINVNGGDHGVIVGGTHYPSSINATGPVGSSSHGFFPTIREENDITITVNGGSVEEICAGNSSSSSKIDNWFDNGYGTTNPSVVGGDVKVVVNGGTIGTDISEDAITSTGSCHAVNGKVTVEINDGTVTGNVVAGAKNAYSYVGGDTSVTINGGKVDGSVYAGGHINDGKDAGDPNPEVKGSTSVTMTGGEVTGNVYGAGVQDTVKGSTKVELKGGTVGGNVYGAGEGSVVEKDVVVTINGTDVTGNVYAAGENSTVKGNSTVELLSGNVGGVLSALGVNSTVEGEAGAVIKIGSAEQAYVGSVGSIEGFDQMVVSEGSQVNMTNANLFDTLEHTYTLSDANLKDAAVTLEGQSTVSVDSTAPITLNFAAAGPLKSGRYKVIDASAATVDTSNWNEQNVTVNGVGDVDASFSNLKWVNNVLYFIIQGQDVSNAMVANWGVFKSSQAFVNTLWGNRTNCVVIKPVYDGKNTIMPTGQTVAWGTVYGQSGRISGAGADYELFGASVGVEHTFKTGRSIGAAFGYDWGTVSPFSCSDIDQESIHLALYGRAGAWKAGQNGTIVLDWSAAYGNTTSETDAVNGDWDQNNIQLDARVSYLRQLRERTMGSVFAGLQYFAAEDSSVDGIGISSMQNVRAEVGVGVSHKATPKTTVYGEVSVYNDVMRHNPNAVVDGHTFYGTNPGRIGGTITAGAEYRLNEDWSLRGSYNFEVADDSVEHNINAGAIYKF